MKKIIFFILFMSLFCFPLSAHRVNIFAYKEGNEIKTESYFNDGTPAKNSRVEVYNEGGKKLLDGETDGKGEFSFSIPDEEGDLRIILVASMGHGAETIITAEAASESKREKIIIEEEGIEATSNKSQEKITIEEEELKRIVEGVVEKAISPVIRMIEEEKARIRFVDIVSGIGFILGICGIAFFLYKRKK